MGVVFLQPVAMRRAVFCVVWSFCMWVSAVSGCQVGSAFESLHIGVHIGVQIRCAGHRAMANPLDE